MKNVYLVVIAALMAIGFSAFTPSSTAPQVYWYEVDGTWYSEELTPCPFGNVPDCRVQTTLHGQQKIYDGPDGNAILRE